jgi:chromosome segregation ATPase
MPRTLMKQMNRLIVIAIVLVGCKDRDDCEKLLDRSPGVHTKASLAECREDLATLRKDPTVRCIIEAETDEAARRCLQGAVDAAAAAAEAAQQARARADDAARAARSAQQTVEQLSQEIEAVDKQLSAVAESLMTARSDADRAVAKSRLEQLRKEKSDVEQRIRAAAAAVNAAERAEGVHLSKECLENPLAKGCS